MNLNWHALAGPVLTAALAAVIAVDRNLLVIPDHAPILICGVAFAAAYGGLASGLVSAVIIVVSIALFPMQPEPAYSPDAGRLMRLIVTGVSAFAIAAMIGLLQRKFVHALSDERNRRATLERLSHALDEMDIGIVLLDADTRAQFINRTFRKAFALPDAKAGNKPPFVALMYHGRDTGAFALPEDELRSYIAARIASVRAGDPTPLDLQLANGQTLRLRCTALPDGGRMLTYTPVNERIRNPDGSYVERRKGDRSGALRMHAAE